MNTKPWCLFSLVLLPIAFLSGRAISQEQGFDKFGVSFGREQYALRDELMTPMTYSNTGTALGIVYCGETTNERHIAMYSYFAGIVRSTTNREMNFIRHYFEYGYHRRIGSFLNNTGKLFLGFSTNNFITTREGSLNMKAFSVTSSEYTAGEYLLSLNVSALCELAFAGNYLVRIQSSFPAIAYITRPHYSISQDWKFADGRLQFIDTYFLHKTSVSAGIPLFGPLEAECIYSFSYYAIQQPIRVQSLMHTFGLSVMYGF